MRLIVTVFLITTLLSACGLGGDNLSLPNERPNGTIHGKVLGGLYIGGSVTAYTLNDNKNRQFLASSVVQENGDFSLEFAARTQLMVIEATGGKYLDPHSLQIVNTEPNFVLSTALMYKSGEIHNIPITPFTHLAAGSLLYLKKSGSVKIDESQLVLENKKIDDLYSTTLGDPTFEMTSQENSKFVSVRGDEKQGLMISAISQIAFDESSLKEEALKDQYNMASLTALMYEDINSDGVLDGKSHFESSSEVKSLAFGNTVIDSNFYRLKMAFAIKEALAYTSFSTFKDKVEQENFILAVAQNKGVLFTDVNNDALYETTPDFKLVTNIALAKKAEFNLDFTVSNALKIKSMILTLDDVEYDFEAGTISKSSSNVFSISIDTRDFTDGAHQLSLVAKDIFDNEGSFQTPITFDNAPPILNIQSSSLTNESKFLLKGTYSDLYSKVKSIVVDSENVALNSDSGWEKAVTLSNGHNEFLIAIEDEIGNQAQIRTHVFYDAFAPVITLSSAILTNTSQYLLEGEFIEGESGISNITVNGNSAGIMADQKWSKLVTLNRGKNEFLIGIEDSAGNVSQFVTDVFLDDLAPTVSVSSAILTNTREFLLEGTYEEGGSGLSKIVINGNPATILEDQKWTMRVSLEVGNNQFLIGIEDEAGNYSKFQTKVMLDLSAPVITLSSAGLSNASQFFLAGTYIDGESGVNKITVNGVDATLLNEQLWEMAVILNSGENKYVIEIKDDAGNYSEFTTTVFLDDITPTIIVTSVALTNKPQFLMEGEYTEAGSGIDKISVNGNTASVLTDNKWSIMVLLQSGKNNFVIEVQDKAGNYVEIDNEIGLDDLSPVISYSNPINARFSNNDGTYIIGLLQLNNEMPLFTELNQLSLSGMVASKENLVNAKIPYLSFVIRDQNLEGLETSNEELIIDYRYIINDLEIISWQSVSLNLNTNEIILPLATETLSNAWYKVVPDDVHKLEIRVKDKLGNSTIETATFKTQFYVPELNIQVNETIDSINGGTFNTRANYIDKEMVAANYSIQNPTDRSFKLRIDDTSSHSVVQDYEEVLRENKVQLRSEEFWQRSTITDIASKTTCPTRNNDWLPLLGLSNLIDGRWLPTFPDVMDLEIVNLETDDPIPPSDTGWVDYEAKDQEFYSYSKGDLAYYFDYLVNYIPDPNPKKDNWNEVRKQPGLLGALEKTIDGIVTKCDVLVNIQTNTKYTYLPVDEDGDGIIDFPRNNIKNKSFAAAFNTSKFIVLGEDGVEINNEDGWYVVPANHTIAITKYVKTPVMVLHTDVSVENQTAINDYNLHSLDKKITWQIDKSLNVETQFNPENVLDALSSVKQQVLPEENITVEFIRN